MGFKSSDHKHNAEHDRVKAKLLELEQAVGDIHVTGGGIAYDDDGTPYVSTSGTTGVGVDDDGTPYLIDL